MNLVRDFKMTLRSWTSFNGPMSEPPGSPRPAAPYMSVRLSMSDTGCNAHPGHRGWMVDQPDNASHESGLAAAKALGQPPKYDVAAVTSDRLSRHTES